MTDHNIRETIENPSYGSKALVKEDDCDGYDRGHHVKNTRTVLHRASTEEAAPLARCM